MWRYGSAGDTLQGALAHLHPSVARHSSGGARGRDMNPRKCPRCGNKVPIDAPEGLCPLCLVEVAMLPLSEQNGDTSQAGTGDAERTASHSDSGPRHCL